MQDPPIDPLWVFATNVRRLRRQQGLTQEQLAAMSGLHTTDIARIETGRREPGLRVMLKLAYGLCVPIGELFEEVGHDPRVEAARRRRDTTRSPRRGRGR